MVGFGKYRIYVNVPLNVRLGVSIHPLGKGLRGQFSRYPVNGKFLDEAKGYWEGD